MGGKIIIVLHTFKTYKNLLNSCQMEKTYFDITNSAYLQNFSCRINPSNFFERTIKILHFAENSAHLVTLWSTEIKALLCCCNAATAAAAAEAAVAAATALVGLPVV